jgi:hypothetical protein
MSKYPRRTPFFYMTSCPRCNSNCYSEMEFKSSAPADCEVVYKCPKHGEFVYEQVPAKARFFNDPREVY